MKKQEEEEVKEEVKEEEGEHSTCCCISNLCTKHLSSTPAHSHPRLQTLDTLDHHAHAAPHAYTITSETK